MSNPTLTVAVCSYNRCDRLPALVEALRAQHCSEPFDILIVDNNSSDETPVVLRGLAAQPGPIVRYVREAQQGIPYARNRALAECMDREFMLFMDDDELPGPGLFDAAVRTFRQTDALCVGGRVEVIFDHGERPRWLGKELMGFLAEIDYGSEPFWIVDNSTPIWTANVAYRMAVFREAPDLRFDFRYNRAGKGVGGGSDLRMFLAMVQRKIRMRYCPEMLVLHHVEACRLTRSYFLRLHFNSGRKFGQFESPEYSRALFGVPPFMLVQLFRQLGKAAWMGISSSPGAVRQGMNFTYALGAAYGRFLSWRKRG